MNKLHYIAIIFIALFTVACKTQSKTTTESRPMKVSVGLDERQSNQVSAIFIDAKKEAVLGNFGKAMGLFQQSLNLDPNHAPSMYEMARIYRMQGRMSDALLLAEKAASIDKDNKWYSILLASLYDLSGQTAKAAIIYENLVVAHPEDIEFKHHLAMLYLKDNRIGDAISIYDKIERISGPDEDIIIQKHQLYLMNDQPEKAVAEIEKLLEMYPDESRYYALIAEIYLETGDYEKAIQSLERISQLDPDNPYIHITLAEYYFKTGQRDKAFGELKSGFAQNDLDLDLKFQVLFTYYSDEQMEGEYQEQINELTEILIATHPDDARPYSLKADFLLRDEKYEEARDLFRIMLSIDDSRFFIWETLLRLNAMLLDNDALLDDSKKAIELFPLQPLPYLFAGLAYYQLKEYNDAVRYLNQGKDLVVDDDDLLIDFYMYLGDTYAKLEQHTLSDEAYEKALEIDPENPYVLNNYSYFLSLRKERLEYAEKMSARSIELSPDNKHYLDTYGWILYQMGNYEEAKIWIEKSIEHNASEDAVVLEHLGDVLYKLGQKEEALHYWKQALELGGEISGFLEKKVRDKTLYE